MEVMEEGDLMDRVPILLQRDRQYYDQNQTVLQEIICPGVVGGTLDFPRSASFASVKMVEWWEDEYYAAYKKYSGLLHLNESNVGEKNIVKASSPEKFVNAITKSADKLLEHIHTLSQEALDHADLTVLTAVIGASALIKNSLWVYLRSVTVDWCPPRGDESGGSLKIAYKQYNEMTEALAERLLDLHVRLLSLYIVQDADCLHWEKEQPFFESERGSYTIQMWWLYIQGTKQDLWNSVPPRMAKRVLAEMLNETLTILTVRYEQIVPSVARSQLVLVDISNLLMCMADILPSVCENGEALAGLNITQQSKSIRDIHCKCHELFVILLSRGVPLGGLYKILRKESSINNLFKIRSGCSSPWIQFAMPTIFTNDNFNKNANDLSEFTKNAAIALELKILLNSSQPDWALLLKILLMRNSYLSSLIFSHLLNNLPTSDCYKAALDQPFSKHDIDAEKCKRFLCSRDCHTVAEWANLDNDPVGQTNYQVLLALTYLQTMVGKSSDIKSTLVASFERSLHQDWSNCLDRRQVWNQKRPPWFEALHHMIYPLLTPIANILIGSMQTGATIYQTMALAISCLTEMLDCLPNNLFILTSTLGEIISTEVRPLGESVLVQTLFSALYTKFIEISEKDVANKTGETTALSKSSICTTLAEAICSIDEDNKHTEGIQNLITKAQYYITTDNIVINERGAAKNADTTGSTHSDHLEFIVDSSDHIPDILCGDLLKTLVGKQCAKLLYNYLKFNGEWLLHKLKVSTVEMSEFKTLPGQNIKEERSGLLQSMFHIGQQPFDQLLTGSLRIDYTSWLQMPLSLSRSKMWMQVSKRYEFQENTKPSIQDTVMIAFIVSQLKS
ncbi:uncharacterized protein LOC129575443 [Sitodiplosis mosellana]|uniref:uncharacterized protein LOC129575443 n=1 Tax=Sitodiplosis mosellana TaxID=263140 RepID=UPI002443E56B|nr:uncharacterized protein LOC129575443 [Sitodiplosis mosellana]